MYMTFIIAALFNCKDKSSDYEFRAAGATFPYIFYQKIFSEYYKQSGVKINYQAIGSGAGVKEFSNRMVDIGGTDAFLSDEQISQIGSEVIHIPTCIGAVTASYNLPGNPEIRLSPKNLADIFMGNIKKWNDESILKNNETALPDLDIKVVYRADSSGTTYIFSDYLSKVNNEWKNKYGTSKVISWPKGVSANNNSGVAGLIKQIKGSIGYIELSYAIENSLPTALIRNEKGFFIRPDFHSASISADIEIARDTRTMITNTPRELGYPITGFSYLTVYKEQYYPDARQTREKNEAYELQKFLLWVITSGQEYAEQLHYSRLPGRVVEYSKQNILSMTYKGERIIENF